MHEGQVPPEGSYRARSEQGWIEGEALQALVPHRGVNLLVDAVRTARDKGEGRLCVAPGDALGRDIFLRESAGGAPVLMEPALAEHLALCAVCVLRPGMGEGEIAFFSVISNFELRRELRAGEPIRSEVRRLRDKGFFRRFEGELGGEGGDIAARADIMAYTAAPEAVSSRRESGKLVAPPEVRLRRRVERGLFAWKRPGMVFADERVDISREKDRATLRYTYPPGHPFCAGHFPGNPVMMGIAQWIAAADAAAWLLFERAEAGLDAPGPGRRRADVEIMRANGLLVAEVRGLVLLAEAAREGIRPPRVERTRRVGFRDQVRPGEAIFIRVRLAAED